MPAKADSRGAIVDPALRRPFVERLRRLCLALPETSEANSWGHPNFRAGKKTFCTFEIVQSRPSIAFRLPPAEARALLRSEGAFSTPYGRGFWVSLYVDHEVDWGRITDLVERSYRTVASKRLVAAIEPRKPNPTTSNRT